MSCNNIISYNLVELRSSYGDNVYATGTINNKPYYLITNPVPSIIYWNGTSWVYGTYITEDNGSITITDLAFYTPAIPTDCPFDPSVPTTDWTFYTPGDTTFTTESEGTFEENICPCSLVVAYEFFRAEYTTTITLTPAGTISGYNYYIFTADFGGPESPLLVDIIIYYDYLRGSWIVKTNTPPSDPLFNTILGTLSSELGAPDCPNSNMWDVDPEVTSYFETTLDCIPPIPPPQPNPQPVPNPNNTNDCYHILVWAKQCEFASCVFKYVQKLQYGSINSCCEELDELLNKKRALEILNCYDTRDIENDTTDYNFITYSQIKHLLNS